jgi:hypothetical protein
MITKQISEREYNIVSFQTSDVLDIIYTEPIYKSNIDMIYYKGYSKYYLEIADFLVAGFEDNVPEISDHLHHRPSYVG